MSMKLWMATTISQGSLFPVIQRWSSHRLRDWVLAGQAGVTVSLDGRRIQAPPGELDQDMRMDLTRHMRGGSSSKAD